MENAKFFTKKYEKINGKHFNLLYGLRGGIVALDSFVSLFSTVRFQVSPQIAYLWRCIVALIAVVWFFSAVRLQMSPQIACFRRGIVALIAFVCLFLSWLPYSTDTDFSSLDISICQLSRRWQPSLGGCKKFEPSLRPGKSSYGWFIFRIGIVHVGKGRYWRKNDKKKFEKPPKLVLFSLQAFHVWSEEQLAATVFLRRTATALFLSVLSILWPSWSMQFRYICNVITRTKCFFKTLLQIY